MKGWFKIPGVQDGDRTLEEQVAGLEDVAVTARHGTVLDLGCAEGLIAKWLCEQGARSVDGLTIKSEQIEAGRKQCKGLPIRFFRADLRSVHACERLPLSAQYDVVLLLSVLHKMKRADLTASWAASKARKLLVLRLPSRHYTSRGGETHDAIAQFGNHGMYYTNGWIGTRGEWIGMFWR